ncbi:diguanylate cyclase [Paraburkholderia terrae]|uniref:diguanylate cyclase domain-containing protein n=1 Tax=Paraburkholderia terrae TaxID=311230 RepID=UPI00336559AF
MSCTTLVLQTVLATPTRGQNRVTPSIRASLLSTLFDNVWPLVMSGVASGLVAVVAFVRLHQLWAVAWFIADLCVLSVRVGIARAYVVRSRAVMLSPGPWARFYGPAALITSLLLGMGTMMCVMSPDGELTSLAIMVAAGILGGIASRNAALPGLAVTQICLGALPIGLGALLASRSGSWILILPLVVYIAAMLSIVLRHYDGLVALMCAEQKHAELAARFDAALAHMPHGLCTLDAEGKVVIANRRTAELFGATVERLKLNVPLPEFIGHAGLAQFGDALREQLVERCTAWLDGERSPLGLELHDGRQLEMTRNAVPDGSTVIVIEDVTARRESEAEILHLARHDPLTGLSNRRHLRDRLEGMLSRHAVSQPPPVGVMYVDLDGFKKVNDTLGHHAGDEVLTTVAERLTAVLRHDDQVARLGGDEFLVVLGNATATTSAALAQRIIEQLSFPYLLSTGSTANIGASVGIAFANGDDSFELLMKRADTALYEAKQAGKGTFRFSTFDPAATGVAADRALRP